MPFDAKSPEMLHIMNHSGAKGKDAKTPGKDAKGREETPGSKEARPPGVFFGHQVFLSPGHQVCSSHEMDFFAKLQIRPRGLK